MMKRASKFNRAHTTLLSAVKISHWTIYACSFTVELIPAEVRCKPSRNSFSSVYYDAGAVQYRVIVLHLFSSVPRYGAKVVEKKKKMVVLIPHAVWDATSTIMAPFRQEQHWIRWAVKE